MKGKSRGKFENVALKIDIIKAYDRIKWAYIETMLEKLGFEARWIKLIMTCVSIVTYKISVNGELVGPLMPNLGIRQGDHFSPYLFILCAEDLSSRIIEAESRGFIQGCRICRGAPSISHLLFVDDNFLFFRAEVGLKLYTTS